jgi:hypothetical protein
LPNREWHPVFVTAVKEALADAGPGQVEILAEAALSSKPLDIDVIVIKKHEEAVLSHPIARIFRKYNLFEFKSPLDYLAANDFDKGLALARLYKAIEHTGERTLDKFTITLVSSGHPRAMMEMLKARHLEVAKGIPEAGFYRVKGEMFLIQIVVINELANPEAIYPFAPFLTGQRRKEIRPFSLLMQKYLQEPANPRRRDLVEFSIKSEINLPEELEEVLAMIRQLASEEKERMKEVLSNSPVAREWLDNAWKEGKTEGKTEGKKEGKKAGEKDGKTEAIFNYLRIKFGLEAGEWQEKVRCLPDTGALDRLLVRLFTAASKEEAQAVIQETLAETTGFSTIQ